MRTLRLPRHVDTTANLASIYPFMAQRAVLADGVSLGTNVLTGAEKFWFDPFTAYRNGVVTNPNIIVAGEPGTGKSTATKVFLYRAATQLGRWLAIADPKGEYLPLARLLDLQIVDLRPGGNTRLNPLDATGITNADDIQRSRTSMVVALLSTVLKRELTSLEDAAVGWSIDELGRSSTQPTLHDLNSTLVSPTKTMCERAGRSRTELGRDIEAVRYGLAKLLDQSLRGMFDGTSTVTLDPSGPGLLLDLSQVHQDPDALASVMVAATASLRSAMQSRSSVQRIQVLDEAWSLLAHESTSRYLQASLKLGRAYGVANLIVIHRLSDLRSQGDDGSATNKIATGLLADAQTRVLFRQSTDQLDEARTMLGLTSKETAVLGRLNRGRAIWKLGQETAVVQHDVAPHEMSFCDTDERMRGGDGG
jgi:type IV secretory pathway VirB4 component